MPPGAAKKKKKNGEAGRKCLKDRKNWGACFRQVKFKVLVGCPGGDSRGLLEIKIGCSGEDLCLRDMFEKNSLRNTTAIALHTNLQVGTFQQCERMFHQHQAWVKLQLALHLLLLMLLQLYHLPPPLAPLVSNCSCLFTQCQSLYASCCTGVVAKSCPTLAIPWTIACQASLSMGFSRQEYWSGLPISSPEDLPNPGIEPRSPALQSGTRLLYSSRNCTVRFGEGNDNPLQYSCLENPMDREAWQAIVHGIEKESDMSEWLIFSLSLHTYFNKPLS